VTQKEMEYEKIYRANETHENKYYSAQSNKILINMSLTEQTITVYSFQVYCVGPCLFGVTQKELEYQKVYRANETHENK
jgi:hypothetical protein